MDDREDPTPFYTEEPILAGAYSPETPEGDEEDNMEQESATYSDTGYYASGEDPSCRIKGRLTKDDITLPSNFIHLCHVGNGDTESEFMDDQQLRDWCRRLGISEDRLENPEDIEFIKQFVLDHGGVEAMKQEHSSMVSTESNSCAGSVKDKSTTHKKEKHRLSKSDIAAPTNFVHLDHFGSSKFQDDDNA